VKVLIGLLIVVLIGLMLSACKPQQEPVCHLVPDPEFGNLVCRYY
jgi:hypothetical protein